MAVEAAIYIASLNSTYPAGSEFVAQGDEHLRLIKSVLLSSFPGLDRAIDTYKIPMSTDPLAVDTTTLNAYLTNMASDIASIETYLYSNPLGDALREGNNLSDVGDVATARTNLSVPEASTVLLKANNLSDLPNVALARTNLDVPQNGTVLVAASNLLDVANVAAARTNLGVSPTTDVMLRANNLSDLASANTARNNLDVPQNGTVLTVANNLSDVGSVSAAQTNLDVYSKAAADLMADTKIAAALSAITDNTFVDKSANFTFNSREDVKIDVSGGAVTATLEAGPDDGAFHWITISGGDPAVNNITLGHNGELFDGVLADQTITADGFYLVYWKSLTNGWHVIRLDRDGLASLDSGVHDLTEVRSETVRFLGNHDCTGDVAPGAGVKKDVYFLIGTGTLVLANGDAVAGDFILYDGSQWIKFATTSGGIDWGMFNNGVSPTVAPTATGAAAIALGEAATSGGANGVAIGTSSVGSIGGVAIGNVATSATAAQGVAIGQSASAVGSYAIAIGSGTTTAMECLAVGYQASATNRWSVAIGHSATASAQWAISIGYLSDATSNGAVALGYNAQATAVSAIAIGNTASCSSGGIAIGGSATTTTGTGIAIGSSAVTGTSGSVAIGQSASATGASNYNNIAIGRSASVTGTYGIAIGYLASATSNNAIALGSSATTGFAYAIVVGESATVSHSYGIGIGYLASVSGSTNAGGIGIGRQVTVSSGATESIAVGRSAQVDQPQQVVIGNQVVASEWTSDTYTRFFGHELTLNSKRRVQFGHKSGVQTTDATPTNIASQLVDGRLYSFRMTVIGKDAGGVGYFKQVHEGLVECGDAAGTATLVGSVTSSTAIATGTISTATSSVTVAANDLIAQVTGVAAITLNWSVYIEFDAMEK